MLTIIAGVPAKFPPMAVKLKGATAPTKPYKIDKAKDQIERTVSILPNMLMNSEALMPAFCIQTFADVCI